MTRDSAFGPCPKLRRKAGARTAPVCPGRLPISPANGCSYFPGWTASVDGRSTPVYRADFNLIGVPLPAGARSVELTFHDAAVSTGKVVTLTALLLAVVALAAGLVTDRRRTRLA